jgi:hypothetical protein
MENNQEGAAFNMAIKRTILQQGPFLMQEEDDFLNVGSIYIDVDNEVIRSSGYVVWTMVLNEANLGELRRAFEQEPDTDAYSIYRRILRRTRRISTSAEKRSAEFCFTAQSSSWITCSEIVPVELATIVRVHPPAFANAEVAVWISIQRVDEAEPFLIGDPSLFFVFPERGTITAVRTTRNKPVQPSVTGFEFVFLPFFTGITSFQKADAQICPE